MTINPIKILIISLKADSIGRSVVTRFFVPWGMVQNTAAKLADNFVPSSVQIAPGSLRCIAHIHTRCATQKSLLFNHAPLVPGKIAATPFWIIVSVAHFLPGEAWFK